MTTFNDQFLRQQANPNDLTAVVQRQASSLSQVSQGFVRVQSLHEIAQEIGALQFRATDPDGQLRMIMSAINLLDELGVDAHFAGVDQDGVVQFYVNADDGKLYGGGGSVILDADGIQLPDAGDSIVFFDSYAKTYSIFSQTVNPNLGRRVMRILTVAVSSLTNLLSNGDFETGDFTGWTETDPTSKISIAAGYNGGYAAFFDSATTSNHLAQSVTSSTYGVLLRLRLKTVSGTGVVAIIVNSVTRLQELSTNDAWRTFYMIIPGSVSNLQISLTGGDAYLDDVVALPIDGAGTTAFASYMDIGCNAFLLFSHILDLKDLSGNSVLYIETDGSGKKIVFNENGQDVDMRAEGDTDANLLFLDASTDRVGIGTATPAEKLDVVGNIKASGKIITSDGEFNFPFATYIDLNPITATGKFPYGGTIEASMSFVRWTVSIYTGTSHSGSAYYTLTLKARQSTPGADVTIATMNTQTIVGGQQNILSTTTFTTGSITGQGYIYLEVTKTGTPADIYILCPSLRCNLT